MRTYDVVIVGGGTMGTAAAWECGKRGLSTLILEQFRHIHTNGAHGGETRIIRHAYAEGADYVPLVARADELWVDLEVVSGQKILHRVGGLEFSAGGGGHAEAARAAAAEHSIPFDWLTPAQIRTRFPQFRVGDDWQGGFGSTAGFLDVETGMHAMIASAKSMGVELREETAVTAIDIGSGRTTVAIGDERVQCDRLIVTAGAWSSKLLANLAIPLEVLRKTLFWLGIDNEALYREAVMPVFISDIPGFEFYGFPQWGRPGIKVALHSGGERTDADEVDRIVSDSEKREIVEVGRQVLNGIRGDVLHATTCLYTVTPDRDFVVDTAPGHSRVVIGAGFSGHGFKFATAIGELLVQIAFGERETLPLLRLNRFAPSAA